MILHPQGKYKNLDIIVDEDVYKWAQGLKWYCRQPSHYIVSQRLDGQYRLIHRLIMNPNKNQQVDHINGNPLDNRRINLRICTPQQNIHNSKPHRKYRRYVGTTCNKDSTVKKPWRGHISIGTDIMFLGSYETEEEAALARDTAAIQLHGEFAKLNFPNVWNSAEQEVISLLKEKIAIAKQDIVNDNLRRLGINS